MDSFEFTKVAAAVLSALLLIFGAKTALEIAGVGRHHDITGGFTLPAATPEAAAPADAGKPAPAAFDPAAVVAMIKTAKPEDATGTFKKCAGCHSSEKGAANKVGPDLWGLVGRPKASAAGFSYSEGMKSKGGNWSYADLAQFIHSPKTFVPGTKMLFTGVTDPTDLANLIAYLRTLSDSPQPLP